MIPSLSRTRAPRWWIEASPSTRSASRAICVIAGSDAVLLVTSWPEYRQVPALLDAMKTKPLLVDGRRFINAGDYAHYTGVGRLPAKERGRFQ